MRTILRTACAAGLLLAAISIAQGQQRGAPAARPTPLPGTSVALIDIKAIFQNHARFKAALDDMKNDVKEYEASLAGQQKDAALLNEKLGTFKVGSPEYKQVEGQIVEVTTQTQVGMALKRKEFLDREAKIYFHAYMEVIEHVTDHAMRNNIALVLAYDGEKIDPSKRASVFEGVNRPVVYQQIADITSVIIQRLNRGTPPPTVGARPQIPVQRR